MVRRDKSIVTMRTGALVVWLSKVIRLGASVEHFEKCRRSWPINISCWCSGSPSFDLNRRQTALIDIFVLFPKQILEKWILSFKFYWLLYVPPGWTFNNSTSRRHSALGVLFVSQDKQHFFQIWHSQVFITEMGCVYWAVRTESLYKIQDNLNS